jgi:RNA polymerase sigma factor (sigma-70 family)
MTTEVVNPGTASINLHQELIDGCKAGDQKAQFQIYKLFYKAMYNASLRVVNDTMEAEDIMQESFLSAFENISIYSGTVSFGAWLKKIVLNRSIDALRKKNILIYDAVESYPEIAVEYQEELFQDEESYNRLEAAKEAMKRLPDKYRIILSLYMLEGYDHEEISEILSIPGSTSRSQLSRAKQRLIEEVKGRRKLVRVTPCFKKM